jgi:hypothetical protein
MSYSFPNKPVVGEPGIGEDNWGTLLNSLLTSIESAINTNLGLIGSHDHAAVYSTLVHGHQAGQILTPIEGKCLDEILSEINGQSTVPISLKTLSDWYNVLNPDISEIGAQANISSTYWGIVVTCNPSSPIFVRTWEVNVRKGTNIIYQSSGASSVFYVHESFGFEPNDQITVQVKLYTGINSAVTSEIYQFTYNPPLNPDIVALQSQVENLTLANIIDTLVADDAAMTAFANRLQASNLLANKVASIINTS